MRPVVLGLMIGIGACGAEPSSTDGRWYLTVDTVRSEIDGSTRLTTTLRVLGKEGPEGSERTAGAGLHFLCTRGSTPSVTVMTDQVLEKGLIDVRLKVDTLSPITLPGYVGSASSGSLILMTAPLDSLLSKLSGHQRALVEYSDGEGYSKTVAEFSVSGLVPFREPFLAACAKR